MTLWRRIVCAVFGHRGRDAGFSWTLEARTVARAELPSARFAWKVCARCGELYGEAQK